MGKKFIAFQIGLVIFGIVLFLGLAELKKRMVDKKAEAEKEFVVAEKECAYQSLEGQILDIDKLLAAGVLPIILREGQEETPDLNLSRIAENDVVAFYIDKNKRIVRIKCF